MPVHNSDISRILQKIADLLAIEGANEFRVRSYQEAAQNIDNLSQSVASLVDEGEDLTKIPGIGSNMAEKIHEIVESGTLQQLEEIAGRTPESLTDLLRLEGLGPERVGDLYEELNIKTLEDLQEAVQKNKVRTLEGFGEKTEDKIREELNRIGESETRTLYSEAREFTQPLLTYLRELEEVEKIEVAGSYRRRKETVGDIDILVTCEKPELVMQAFTGYDDVEEIIASGETKSTVRLRSGLQVDLRVVKDESYGAALVYFTGSKQHNIRLRDRALERDMKINEYGVYPQGEEDPVAGVTEEEVYDAVGLPYIHPELREDRGEIEAAENDLLPDLLRLDDLQGDLQMHTTASDGRASIREMAEAARNLGHSYIAITDHSKRVTVANGLNAEELAEQIELMREVDEEYDDFRILKAVEVDILKDGSLDLPDAILEELDLRVCCVHYHQDLSGEQQTSRILKAMENPHFNILGHPTGREFPDRDEMDLDMETIIDSALERGCFLELNSTPRRLDLNDIYCKMAKERGLKLAISTDAHSPGELENLRYGVNQARRGWLEIADVLNTRDADQLLNLLERT